MEIASPAKINLFLEITGKRTDGYHNLSSLMCCIGLCDTINLSFGQKKISLQCAHPDVPESEANLAWRAAQAFFRISGIHEGLHIHIEKNIPIGAGLGGGSSNAATVLKALNLFYNYPISYNDLILAGKSIGSDIPFFIYGKPAVASGIGDILTPCHCIESRPIVLIYPSVPVSTAEVYKNLNLRLTKNKKKITKNLLKLNSDQEIGKYIFNDLEPAAFQICPDIIKAKTTLQNNGARAALMTGSGSAVFGLYPDKQSAKTAYEIISQEIAKTPAWQVYLTHLVA